MDLDFNTSQVVMFTKVYLAVFYSTVAAFYTFRVINNKRKHGKPLVFPGERFCNTWWNHIAFRIFRIFIWMVCLFRLFYPNVDNYLGMINFLELSSIIIMGLILLTLGFLSTALIHCNLGKEWRSGIDPSGPNELISSGLYKFSRNPMYVCIAIAQLGFFLCYAFCFFSFMFNYWFIHTKSSNFRRRDTFVSKISNCLRCLFVKSAALGLI
jgi:protein-S-isoprenylcysteine O-methyltransferase Ste14